MGSRHGTPRGIRRAVGAAAVLLLALSLAACSSSSSRSTTPTVANSGGSSTTSAPGSNSGGWTSCTQVPLAMIDSSLDLNVTDPQETIVNSTSTCGYTEGGAPSPLILQLVTKATGAEFASAVQGFKSHGQDPTPVAGLGDEAASVTLAAAGVSTTTVMARQGSSQVLVSASATLDQVTKLVKQILPNLS
jgi:hypothetical protein